MPTFQRVMQGFQRVVPRGWAPVVRLAARVNPALRRYPAAMRRGDSLVLDLRQNMCLGYFFHGEIRHEVGLERLIGRVLKPGSVFVDVGANIGYYPRMASRLVGPAGHVYAVEPQPPAIELLRANLAGLANATLLPLAMGEAEGEVDFFVRERGDLSSLEPTNELDPGIATTAVKVRMSTLDRELAAAKRVDLVKIDVEGFELQVLRGARETISRHQPLVTFEYIDTITSSRGVGLADFAEFFRELGYTLHWVNEQPGDPAVTSAQPSSDVLAVPASRAGDLGPLAPVIAV